MMREQQFVVTDHEHIAIVNRMDLLVVCWLKYYVTEVAKQFMSVVVLAS